MKPDSQKSKAALIAELVHLRERLGVAEANAEGTPPRLRQNEAVLRKILEDSPIGVAVVSHPEDETQLTGKRLFVNEALARMFGGGALESFLNADISATWADLDQLAIFEHALINHVGLTDFEARRVRMNDGSEWWASLNTRPLRFGGRDCTMVWHFDITDRVNGEIALRQSEERLKKILDNLPSAVFLQDAEGRPTLKNKRFDEWFGGSDIPLPTFLKSEATTGFDGKLGAGEVDLTLTDGSRRTVVASKFLVPGYAGASAAEGAADAPDAEATIITDITKLAAAEKQLRQSQKMEAVGQLTGGIAHDFNNLLGVVIGNLEFLTDEADGNDRMSAMLATALKAALNGAELTHRLLAFSRKQPLSPKVIDLNEHMSDMLGLLRRTLGATITVDAHPAPDLWATSADPTQVENALLNLAVNARDAMPEGGTLTLETDNVTFDDEYAATNPEMAPGDYVVLAVTDTGDGIAPEIIERIFEPFFTTKRFGEGSGLGLSMVFGFARQSGGHASAYSEVGRGSTFRLYLPRAEQEPKSTATEVKDIPRSRGETVLVIEDNAEFRLLAVKLLSDLGYDVLNAANGPKALAIAANAPRINLILSDIVLPGGMNGPETVQQIEALTSEIPTLFMSGYPRDALTNNGRVNPETLLLEKPFRKIELAHKLREALGKTQATAQEKAG